LRRRIAAAAGTPRLGPVESPSTRDDSARLRDDRQLKDLVAEAAPTASRRDRMRRRALGLADGIALTASFLITGFATTGPGHTYALLLLVPLWIALNKVLGLYDRDASVIDKSTLNEIPKVVESVLIGAGLILLVAPLVSLSVHRHQALEFAALAIALTTAGRMTARLAILRLSGRERAVIIGSGRVARLVARKLGSHPGYGVDVVGYIDIPPSVKQAEDGETPLLGDLTGFAELCRRLRVDRVVVAFSNLGYEHLLDAIRASNALGLKLTIVPRLFEVLGRALLVDEIEGMPLLSLRGVTRSRSALAAKRVLDLTGATLGLVILAPLLLAIAVAVKLTSPGPVLYRHDRLNRDGSEISVYKFRTMDWRCCTGNGKTDVEVFAEMGRLDLVQEFARAQKVKTDPRVTRVGSFLRRTSLDELPQLLNILRGDMSLVGPRPIVRAELDRYGRDRSALATLKPGLTGLWQISGRNDLSYADRVKIDTFYIESWSLWLDIKIILRTILMVVRRRGAY
jgi:exopolysaccharide biosynthesis polyprenyl glycosylphosphotransferase